MGDQIGHAEIQIGDSHVMLADEFPERDIRGPKARGGMTSSLMIYVDDVDTAFQRRSTRAPRSIRAWRSRINSTATARGP